MAAKTSPPSILAGLKEIPTFPYNGQKLDDDRTIAQFLAQALYIGAKARENKGQDAGDVVTRGLLAQRILDAPGSDIEVTATELELIEKCICGAMLPQFITVLVMHLKQNVHPKLAADPPKSDKKKPGRKGAKA